MARIDTEQFSNDNGGDGVGKRLNQIEFRFTNCIEYALDYLLRSGAPFFYSDGMKGLLTSDRSRLWFGSSVNNMDGSSSLFAPSSSS